MANNQRTAAHPTAATSARHGLQSPPAPQPPTVRPRTFPDCRALWRVHKYGDIIAAGRVVGCAALPACRHCGRVQRRDAHNHGVDRVGRAHCLDDGRAEQWVWHTSTRVCIVHSQLVVGARLELLCSQAQLHVRACRSGGGAAHNAAAGGAPDAGGAGKQQEAGDACTGQGARMWAPLHRGHVCRDAHGLA